MKTKLYWGIATLIILIICAGIFSIQLIGNQDTEPQKVFNPPSDEVLDNLRHKQVTPTPEITEKAKPIGESHETPHDKTSLISGEIPHIQEMFNDTHTDTETESEIDLEKRIDEAYTDLIKSIEDDLSQLSPASREMIRSVLQYPTKAEYRKKFLYNRSRSQSEREADVKAIMKRRSEFDKQNADLIRSIQNE